MNTKAFPTHYQSAYNPGQEGMDLLDWFAGQVLASMGNNTGPEDAIASRAYEIAAAMMEERKEYV